ncbi:exonuclease domain-containing protein [Proteiniclasticum sp.]|uniref:exonuclease domain-containing protein n=1 Tax=Proteiniclasticum sp. TaxID=2053595 RepID=UPI0025DF09A6|nr:exonuclease domain-containing protein [Proteiniclasticum sp.]
MQKVTYFDVEYANSRNKSICQLGLLCEDYLSSEPYYPERNIYLNPGDGFDDICIRIHGITSSKVKNEPLFSEIWPHIEKYFTNTVVIGHNVAGADLNALVRNLKRYNIDIPELYYVCTLDLARQYVPSFAVENFKLSTLCSYFDIDIDSEHDAFDDACANADLLKAMINAYKINIDDHIKRYNPVESNEFQQYIAGPVLRKAISEFYGIVRGFSIDNRITSEEADYIKNWRNQYCQYTVSEEVASIIDTIDTILEDGVVTVAESFDLQRTVRQYMDLVSTSPVTLATQILNGIMQGIIIDGEISAEESEHLRRWLYDNIYLSGHHPFDKVMEMLEKALSDSIITKEESEYITKTIRSILNPVEELKVLVHSVEGKNICLTGNFAYGSKPDVAQYLKVRGGLIDSTVKKSTDILLVGALECQAYSHGTYGQKVLKAMEYNEKGCKIEIVKRRIQWVRVAVIITDASEDHRSF